MTAPSGRLARAVLDAIRRAANASPADFALAPAAPQETTVTDRTPAETLTFAAQRLLDLADAAQDDLDTGSYWRGYDPKTAWADGFVNGMGGACSEYAAVLPPAVGRHMAQWLRDTAESLRASTHPEWQDTVASAPLAVARQILGEVS